MNKIPQSKLFSVLPDGTVQYKSWIVGLIMDTYVGILSKLRKPNSYLLVKLYSLPWGKIIIFLFILSLPIAPASQFEIAEFRSQNFNTNVVSQRSFGIGFLSISNLLLVFLFIITLNQLVKLRKKINIYSYEIFILVFLVISEISTIGSINLQSSFVWFLKLMLCISIYFVFSRIKIDKKIMSLIVQAFIFIILFEAIIAFMQFLIGGLIGIPIVESITRIDLDRIFYSTLGSETFRAVGTLSHPNMLSGYLTLLSPFIFVFLLTRPYKSTLIYYIIMPLLVGTIFITYSRWGMITLIFAVCIIFLLFRKLNRSLIKKVFEPIKISVILILILTISLLLNPFISSRFLHFSPEDASLEARANLIDQAFFVIKQNPLGIGGGSSVAYLANLDVTTSQISSRYLPTVHEFYLLMAAEVGIVGLIVFLLFIASIIRGFYLRISNIEVEYKLVGIAIVASLLIFLFNGLWEPRPLGDRIGLFLFLIMGLLVNITNRHKSPVTKTS